ncbi:metallophosphoesterase family protein [Acetatifactor aquisgranensis]|uniref:metallophosphoesterase family protein n=1 Tax=Acetatifactor aquisgranensis TaxID=2941233 RepID=UPI00203FC9A9|nr:metallophosphoesterase family protein [Acetatifactor aquisgranensis]
MKIGIISDIHSNIIALKACIEYMKSVPCDEYLFLGDYISDTPYTRETMDYLYDFSSNHSCLFLRGNREEYMLEQRKIIAQGTEKGKWTWNSATGNLLFTYRQLDEKDFLFFDSLPITSRYQKAGFPPVTICHGSPVSSRERLPAEGENTKKWLKDIHTDYLICGHTHLSGELEYQGKHYYNCGSAGIAIGTYGYAHCMIMEDVRMNGKMAWKPAFLKIPYDNKQVVQDIKTSGLLSKAPWFVNSSIQILLTGADHSAQLVGLADKLAREAGEQDFADEKYWREAARQLGVPDYR